MRTAVLAHGSRKLRVEYPGAIYHLLNRGDSRETDLHTLAMDRRSAKDGAATLAGQSLASHLTEIKNANM
jgi:hypothetical protein